MEVGSNILVEVGLGGVGVVGVDREDGWLIVDALKTEVERFGIEQRMQVFTRRVGSWRWRYPAEDGPSSTEDDVENFINQIVIFIAEVVGGGFGEKIDEVTFKVLRQTTRKHRHSDVFAVEFEGNLPAVIFPRMDLSDRDDIHFLFYRNGV